MDRETLAKRLKVEKSDVSAWEDSGELKFSQLERLAEKTHTPIGFLFLPEPPVEKLPLADFRRVGGSQPSKPSPELLDTIYQCQNRQAWYQEYLRSVGSIELDFVGSATLASSSEAVGAAIRQKLHLDEDPTSAQRSWEEALAELFRRVEAIGVLVMRNSIVGNNSHRHLHVEEFRGFALSDSFAPLIFVNSADAKSAQMFTVVHELCHIWLGESAVSDVSPNASNPIERFCNRVAAEVLVPSNIFVRSWRTELPAEAELQRLARQFKVSMPVVLIRALESSLISRDEFDSLWLNNLKRESFTGKAAGGGDFYNTQASRLGRRFARAVLVSALEGRVPYTDAFRLLNLKKASTFDEMARQLGVTF